MSSMKRIITSIILLLIIVSVTLVFFYVGLSNGNKTRFDYIALVFILVSEISLFTGLILLSMNNTSMGTTLIRTGIATTLFAYWILTTLLSLFYKSIINQGLGVFITAQAIIIGVSAIICILLFVSSNYQHANKRSSNTSSWLQSGQNIVFSLKNDLKLESYKPALEELYETLKYSDNIPTDIDLDKEINNQITQLSNCLKNNEACDTEANEYINKIISMIKERNMVTLQSKRGGF